MPSQQESDQALMLAEKTVRDLVSQIQDGEVDGRAVLDQAHGIAWQVSQALQQHSRTCSVILPFLLSVAAEVRATMNQGLVPQWNRVRDDDPRMESHPFFTKTVGYHEMTGARASASTRNSLPRVGHVHNLVVPGTMPDKGKRPDRGTHRSREDSPGAESGRKKKLLKRVSKAVITDTEDEDWWPTGTIIWSKLTESSSGAPPKSKGNTKNMKQPDAEPKIGRPQPQGKGKEKAVDVTEPIRERQLLKFTAEEYTPPCKRCIGEPCQVMVGRKGQAIKSCAKCHYMKVWCNRPVSVDTRGPPTTQEASKSLPRAKAAPASKSKAQSRTTRATSCVRPPTPMLESEDASEDTEASVSSDDDAEMDDGTDAEQHTDVTMEKSVDPDQIMVDQPIVIASADDFPADHWLENTDDAPILIPSPTPAADPLSLPSATSAPTILERVLALTTQVTAMQMANETALARVNAMEQEFDARISSMRAELSSMQLDVSATVTLVNGLVSLVEKLRQEWVLPNPSFALPMIGQGNDTLATAFGMRYLNC
ncbi:hypothetical protein EV424DRAFT_1544021 [Suillus variegatus]|nr:hypothetical protein EV424DRAFT_1544021 [Suillus variegatus]